MPTRKSHTPTARAQTPAAAAIFDTSENSLLDVLDNVLNKGVMATGDITLGLAGVDLIYVRLSALLCAADRVMPTASGAPSSKRRPRRKRRS